MIRAALTSLVNLFRESLDAIVVALGFDPTGITNVSVTIGKDLVRQITAKLKSIAQYIEDAATVYYLIKDIQNIIAWVQTLPAKIKAIIQQCLNNLNNSITTVQNQLKSLASSIPNQLNASATQVTTQLSQGLTATANALKTSSSSANGNIDPALVPIVGGSTSNSDLANLSTYLTKTNPSTAQAMQNTYGSQASTKTSP
jgi:hypothetical protein